MGVANPVLFHLGKSPWTLGGVCTAVGIVMVLIWVALLPFVIRKLKMQARRLDAQEAATLAMTGHEVDYVKPQPAVQGPAAGLEWHFEMSIGDLRSAWQQRRYGYFVGAPAYGSFFILGGMLIFDGLVIRGNNSLTALLLMSAPFLLLCSSFAFMMWAAVFTELE